MMTMGTTVRKAILYIAVSVDGYIADENGSVEWISGHDDNVSIPL